MLIKVKVNKCVEYVFYISVRPPAEGKIRKGRAWRGEEGGGARQAE